MRTRPRKKAELLKLGYISSTLVLLLIDIGRALKQNPESKLQCVVPRPIWRRDLREALLL